MKLILLILFFDCNTRNLEKEKIQVLFSVATKKVPPRAKLFLILLEKVSLPYPNFIYKGAR